MNELPTLPLKKPVVMDTLYNYSATILNSGDIMEFSSLRQKLVLVVNIGLGEDLAREIGHLEKLVGKFANDGLVVLVFPCHQFSEGKISERDVERRLQDVRCPESDTLVIFSPVLVNGNTAHPLFRYLCHTIPMPTDDPLTFIDTPEKICWQPVLRSDIAGNFEKFLLLPNGRPYKRYSSHFLTANLGYDIKVMINMLKSVRKEGKSGTKYALK